MSGEVAAPPVSRRGARETLISWVREHDDRWAFTVTYVGLALILSIAVSLFWLVAVVGFHFLLEYARQRSRGYSMGSAIGEASWEVSLDVGLILFALVLALYLDLIFGLAGLGPASRAGVNAVSRAAPRFAGWQTALRAGLLSLDDIAQIAKNAVRRSAETEAGVMSGDFQLRVGWVSPWSRTDWICVIFLSAMVLFLGLAPIVLDGGLSGTMAILKQELTPLPGR
jgi:hypothetical protein